MEERSAVFRFVQSSTYSASVCPSSGKRASQSWAPGAFFAGKSGSAPGAGYSGSGGSGRSTGSGGGGRGTGGGTGDGAGAGAGIEGGVTGAGEGGRGAVREHPADSAASRSEARAVPVKVIAPLNGPSPRRFSGRGSPRAGTARERRRPSRPRAGRGRRAGAPLPVRRGPSTSSPGGGRGTGEGPLRGS